VRHTRADVYFVRDHSVRQQNTCIFFSSELARGAGHHTPCGMLSAGRCVVAVLLLVAAAADARTGYRPNVEFELKGHVNKQLAAAPVVGGQYQCTMHLYNNTSCTQKAFKWTQEVDPAGCCATCATLANCTAWEWFGPNVKPTPGEPNCHLKVQYGRLERKDGVTCGMTNPVPPLPPAPSPAPPPAPAPPPPPAAPGSPNIVWFLTDDQVGSRAHTPLSTRIRLFSFNPPLAFGLPWPRRVSQSLLWLLDRTRVRGLRVTCRRVIAVVYMHSCDDVCTCVGDDVSCVARLLAGPEAGGQLPHAQRCGSHDENEGRVG
jgi:hypothetical protein